ncbi:MAG: hypothetical protein R3359_06265, partial [Marinirhabdus sp.]|nr:hypothetical protein [Marinirhabdus sp.]
MKTLTTLIFTCLLLPCFLWQSFANDECANSTPIVIETASSTTISDDTLTATESLDGSCENVTDNNLDLWYNFTMPVDGNLVFSGVPSTLRISIFDSCGGAELYCSNDDGIVYGLSATTAYILRISERDTFAGTFSINAQAFAAASNDECVDRTTILVETANANTYSTDTRAATESLDASCDTASSDNLDVWYEFTMPVDGNFVVSGISSTVGVTVYDACGGNEIECDNDDTFVYGLSAATVYVLRIREREIFAGSINFNVQAFATAPNDECVDRTSILVETANTNSYSIDLRTATESLDASCDDAASNNLDVWYEFTMPVNGNFVLTGISSTVGVSLYDACGGNEIACDNDDTFVYDLTAASVYVLRIRERQIFANNVTFNVQAFETAANDECIDRTAILVETANTNTYSVNLRAATESLDASCDDAASNNLDVWYELTMPVDGNFVLTGIPSTVGVTMYDACGGNEIKCDNDDTFVYSLTEGAVYVLRIRERQIFASDVTFNVQAFETAPNDECATAEVLNVGAISPITVTFDSRAATESIDATCETASNTNLDVWYSFSMPVNGDIEISNASSLTNFTLLEDCGGLELGCSNGNSTFFGLSSGTTYKLRVARREVFAAAASFSIVANPAPLPACATTTEFIGGSWSAGPPNASTNAIIRSNYQTTNDGSFVACSLSIDSGTTVVINSGDYIDVSFDVNNNGTLTIQHEGSLVQRDDTSVALNNGNIDVLVETPTVDPNDFLVMGSPVTGETRGNVWNSAFLVLEHNTSNFVPNPDVATQFPMAENFADDNGDFWSSIPNPTAIEIAEGYIVRPQTGYGQPGGVFNYNFDTGTFNNGEITYPVLFNTTKNDSPNVFANPYPSAISAVDFIAANAMVDEVYFWEHLTPPSTSLPGYNSMNFSMEDISMYNLMGGTAAPADPTGVDTRPNGFISTAQGFGIKANAAGTAVFNNSMRRVDNNNTLRDLEENVDRIWLTVSNADYALSGNTLIGFSDENLDAFENGYDSRRLASVVSLYSLLPEGEAELGIQSLPQMDGERIVKLGFSTAVEGDAIPFTIKISEVQGDRLSNATVYLRDNTLNTIIDLSA